MAVPGGSESDVKLRRYAARNQRLGVGWRTISLAPLQSHILFVLSAKFGLMPARGTSEKQAEGWSMSFEMNKILGALLGAMILAMVTGFIADMLVRPEELAKPAYMVAGVKEAAATAAAAPTGPEPIGPLLASADAAKGKEIANRLCVACHTFNKGDPNRIGPNLYDVFAEPIAEGHNDYPFSSALKAHEKEKWTAELLNAWLANPQDFAHGTKMTFVGLPKAKDRADVIAYLDSLSDHPAPLTAAPAAAPAPAKPQATPAAPAPNGAAKPPAAPPATK